MHFKLTSKTTFELELGTGRDVAVFLMTEDECRRLMESIQNDTGEALILRLFTALRKGDEVLISNLEGAKFAVDSLTLFNSLRSSLPYGGLRR